MYQDVLVIIINIVVAILGPLLYHFCWQAIPAELVALRSLGTSWGPVVDDVFLVQVPQCIMEMKVLLHDCPSKTSMCSFKSCRIR